MFYNILKTDSPGFQLSYLIIFYVSYKRDNSNNCVSQRLKRLVIQEFHNLQLIYFVFRVVSLSRNRIFKIFRSRQQVPQTFGILMKCRLGMYHRLNKDRIITICFALSLNAFCKSCLIIVSSCLIIV